MLRSRIGLGLLVWAASLAAVSAGETKATSPGKNDAAQALGRLKQLVGDWEMVNPKIPGLDGKVVVRYRLSAQGSAVVETVFPDLPKEMVTIYHRDGDQLVLTHYCCCGNQPRMRARIGDSNDELNFEFAGGSNLDPAKDRHMHNHRLRFVDADHLHAEWDLYDNGKPAGTHMFDLVRKK